MAWKFDSRGGLVKVAAKIVGPVRSSNLSMALDTGATHSFIRTELLEYVGYDPSSSLNKVNVATGGGNVYSPVISVARLVALDFECSEFPVTAIDLPSSTSIDGVIGLDFLRGHKLLIDFVEGAIQFD